MGVALMLGLAYALVNVSSQTQVQENVPPALRGRVFATQLAFANAAAILPMVFLGGLADLIGISEVALLAGTVVLLVGFNFTQEWLGPDVWRPTTLLRGFPLIMILAFWRWTVPPEPTAPPVRRMLIHAGLISLVYLLVSMLLSTSLGGPAEWGPRLILPLIPLMVLFVVYVIWQLTQLSGLARWSASTALVTLLIVSIVTQLAGFRWSGQRSDSWSDFSGHLLSSGETILVSNIHWLAHLLPEVSLEKTLFLVSHDEHNLAALLERFESQDVSSFLYVSVVEPDAEISTEQPPESWHLASSERVADGFHTLYDLSIYRHESN
jgi:hypothetical protein